MLLVGALAGACVDVPRKPLDPAAIERELRARSLADPALCALCVARLHIPDNPWPPDSVDLALLTLAAWHLRPELGAARAEVAAAEAKVQTARTPANPTLSLQPGRVVNATGSPWFLAASAEFVVPLGGRREAQAAVAAQEVEIARLLAAETAWRIYGEVRDAALDAAFAQRELELAQQAAVLRAEFAAQVDARVRTGAAASPEHLAALLEADRARAAAIQASSARSLAQAKLAAACGLSPAALDTHPLSPPGPLPRVLPDAVLLDRLDVRRGLAEYEAAERALELELRKQYPDLRLGPGYEYDQGDRKFLLGIGVDLPLFDRNQGPIAEAVAKREIAAAHVRERQSAALAAVDVARVGIEAATARVLAFGDEARARLQARRDAAARALAAGASDHPALTQVELELLFFEQERLAAERAQSEAQARFEDALQRPIDPRVAALAPTAVPDPRLGRLP